MLLFAKSNVKYRPIIVFYFNFFIKTDRIRTLCATSKTESGNFLRIQELFVPNIKSAEKRVVISEKARQRNVAARSKMRTLIKNVIKAIIAGNKEDAKKAFTAAESVLDRAANKGLIHTNKAARHKSKLAAKIKAMN